MRNDHPAHYPSTESIKPVTDFLFVGGFRLSVIDGPDRGRTFTSSGSRTVIGSDPTTDLSVEDPTVSRFHAEIIVADATATVRDLGSTNGSLVNGVCVREARLDPGAILAIGRTQIRFELLAEPVRVRLSQFEQFGRMVGRSIASRRAFALLEQAAVGNATVLLNGETGTGKEIAAESIHAASSRSGAPFVVIDCGAIPPNLIESELFGHERGAFTGADRAREGAFEAANGGTIFLDEIGELEVELQPKLLRVLEKREVRRVGSNRVLPLDVRVIAATNRDLRAEVNAKRFRADLYFRLAVFEITLPPLRERVDDLPLLVGTIVEALGATSRAESAITRSTRFLDAVRRHHWPGNVRELRNYVERCLAMQEEVPIASLPEVERQNLPHVDTRLTLVQGRERVIATFERAYLETIVAEHGGNVSAASRAASVDRAYFHRLLRKYGMRGGA